MIQVQSKKNQPLPVAVERLEKAILETLKFTHTPEDSAITLVLSDDKKLRQLNRDFMGIDSPTDVLSFPADFIDPDSQEHYLGDIIISVPRAIAQAEENHGSIESELTLLAVHGTLHLLGFDHATVPEKESMWAVQNAIIGLLT